MEVVVGHSPDADDAYMFYALAAGKIDTGRYVFRHALHDIETLNRKAQSGELPVTAISVAAYPDVADKYLILRSGGSFGDGYGPVVVGRRPGRMEDLRGRTIAVPGLKTSAFLALSLALPEFRPVAAPFDQIMEIVSRGEADAGLLIHEGQLTYAENGLHLLLDLGVWWKARAGGLPLPLGVNAIRRDLGTETLAELSRLLSASISYARSHPAEAESYAQTFSRGLDPARTRQFVNQYVNDLTADMGERGERAIRVFLEEGRRRGLVETDRVEFL
ncbi:MAG: ABC transporter substrate-binding protein [Candidatus Lindowbacteria bacterium RIFCSPLOWO2_12_FULL_62_27]|nr:MAG: ABC transporter substrate-binding protein [Candidatus Lindowbacteria bacterium RIFCSPLOWO2_12_FULL_62_27]OGH63525.1 MAG: ABC transporter substrate-binding protein [Candidatus Lindowbacteria bacterium RIFCSPLOWO2_02_FULL_62_12]